MASEKPAATKFSFRIIISLPNDRHEYVYQQTQQNIRFFRAVSFIECGYRRPQNSADQFHHY